MDFRIAIDATRCSGCRACQLACSEAHGDGFRPSRSRLFVVKDDVAGLDQPTVCHFCDNAACVAACPTQALTQHEAGWLALNADTCIGCLACVDACPHQALRADSSAHQPLACDGCHGAPVCVAACAMGALAVRR